MPAKRSLKYEGKAKKVWETDDPGLHLIEFKDDATAFNAQKRGTILGKGRVNNQISARLYSLLEGEGVPTHFLERSGEREQVVRAVEIIPIEVVVRNVVAGSFAKRLGLPEGGPLEPPVVEFCYKSDPLGDPLINADTAVSLGFASPGEVERIRSLALRVNDFLKGFFAGRRVRLADFKLEFGRLPDGTVVLADEISPDTCRFWDAETNEKLDKDRFRRDLGGVEEAYEEMLRRVLGDEQGRRTGEEKSV
ncbi:MAG TPA: phosphoribosylaminoimidazolesuccinocarboxamide synthase [Deinococcales bacterium]|nr:phosphoribosylaminoimidazolesuccinocarboxamide synthase [Deinococcales bacterium]